jgi:FkbM family methyltransferase
MRTRTVQPRGLPIPFDVIEGDTILGPAIERGRWAEHESRLMLAHVRPGARVLDLGANVGWFSAQALLAGAAEVHAFEPVPFLADACQKNLERAAARGGGRFTLHRCAAGEASGAATIQIGAGNLGDNRVLDRGAARPSDMGQGAQLEIAIERVDALVRGPVDFLKIDTQGSEWLALRGASELLAASPRFGLLMELWPYALRGATPEQLLDLLFGLGLVLGKATEAPYPMSKERLLRQARERSGVKGGMDLYGVRGRPFHVRGAKARLHGIWRSWRES